MPNILDEYKTLVTFLQEKRDSFNLKYEDFYKNPTLSFSPVDPNFEYFLEPFKIEAIENLDKGRSIIIAHYKSFNSELQSDSFIKNFKNVVPNERVFKYQDREEFLLKYYKRYPDEENHGEGEYEWTKMCFEGFLYSYQKFISKIQKTVELLISNSLANSNLVLLDHEKTLEEIKDIIESVFYYLKEYNADNKKFLEEPELKRLIASIIITIDNRAVPENLKPFEINGIQTTSLRWSFRLIHEQIFGMDNVQNYLLEFYKDCFSKPKCKAKTITGIKKKFMKKPINYPYKEF